MSGKRSIPFFLIVGLLALLGSRGSMSGARATCALTPQTMLAPYVPTPQDVVERMLKFAEVTAKDTVYDLGCGDGRIVITAAKLYGAHGVGVDLDPALVRLANTNAKKAGVDNLVQFLQQDAMTLDVSKATVVTLYLLPLSNLKLRPMLTKELKPGARIVSHMHDMDDWAPTKTDKFTDRAGRERTLYLWVADGKIRN